jgi:serine protease Do
MQALARGISPQDGGVSGGRSAPGGIARPAAELEGGNLAEREIPGSIQREKPPSRLLFYRGLVPWVNHASQPAPHPTRYPMMRLLAALAILAAASLPAHAIFHPTREYAAVGWWRIGYDAGLGRGACYAHARYADDVQLWIGSLYSNENAEKVLWFVAIHNPRWTWIKKDQDYKLTIEIPNGTTTRLDFEAVHHEKDNTDFLIAPGTYESLINMLAVGTAKPLRIWGPNSDKPMSSLAMTDSADAIEKVVHCLRDHPALPVASKSAPPAPKLSGKESSGTGFFVAPRKILTNNHVIKNCGTMPIMVSYPNSRPERASAGAQDDTNDLALLQSELSNSEIASFRFGPRLGEPVATFGFPFSGLLSSGGNFTLGNITSLSGLNDDTRALQTSTPIQPGNSGGPLLDMTGGVVGVIVFQLNALKIMEVANNIPQNVNFAIQAPIVINFLTANGVTPVLADKTRKLLQPADLADLAKTFTVQVSCLEHRPDEVSRSAPKADLPNPTPTTSSAKTDIAEDRNACSSSKADEAITACSRLIGSGRLSTKEYVLAYRNRASVYEQRGRLKDALHDLNVAHTLDPDDESTPRDIQRVEQKMKSGP